MTTFATKPIPPSKPNTTLVERPWGHFLQYANNQEATVSLMLVKPGQRLSLQAHTGRAELWIALDDGAKVEIDDQVYFPKQGDELWIAAGARHRLSCMADESVRVLEVAFGNWQQEDIIRFADDYQRPGEGE